MNKRLILSIFVTLCLLVLSVIPCFADSPIFLNISTVDSTNFPTVLVNFTAWDSNGIPLTDLTTDNIFIHEDNLSEIHPVSLVANTDAQLSVVLVLDVSGSMAGQPLTDAKNAANRFLDRLNKSDEAAVIAFSDKVDTDPASINVKKEVGFSNDLANAYDLIEGLTASGGTEVYNAVEKAVKMVSALPAGHRAILLFTDGKNDPANVGDPQAGISLAKEAGIPIFAIGLGSDIDEKYLQSLTSETGGFYRSTPRSSELSDLFYNMAILLKTDYTANYSSSLPSDGKSHNISFRLESAGSEALAEAKMGQIPLASTPEPTAAEITPVVTESVQNDQMESGNFNLVNWLLQNIWADFLILMVLAGAVFSLIRSRKKALEFVEKCGKCGAVLTEPGACQICGSTQRIKTRK